MTELWDTFTAERLPTGRTVTGGAALEDGQFRVVVHVCLFNRAGDMLLQRRAPTKELWPGRWDFSTGGSVTAGETSGQGAQREVFEELGCRIELAGVRPNFTFNFAQGFDDFFLLDHEVEIGQLAIPNREVTEARWAGRSQVHQLLRAGRFVPYRASLVDFVFDSRHHGDILEGS